MNQYFKSFLRKNIIITLIILAIGSIIYLYFSIPYFSLVYLLIPPFALIINIIGFKISSKKTELDKNPTLLLTKSFALKFFSYLGITIFYLVIESDKLLRITFVIILFCIYTIFTILEVTEITRLIKAEHKLKN